MGSPTEWRSWVRRWKEEVESLNGAARPRILEAEDGLQACEVLKGREVQLLIVDLVMPPHEGLETIRSSCRRGHKLKILAISGQRPEYLKAAGLLGANAALRKPFTPAELRSAVERLLEDQLASV